MLADSVTEADHIEYKDIPNFPLSTVEGHKGKLVVGLMGQVAVMLMQGRFHGYEGYPLRKVLGFSLDFLVLSSFRDYCKRPTAGAATPTAAAATSLRSK